MDKLEPKQNKHFDDLRHIDENGTEYWLARELQGALLYKEWRNFSKVIDTAKIACKISQQNVADHFVEVSKMVEMPTKPKKNAGELGFGEVNKTKMKAIPDYKLTRYGRTVRKTIEELGGTMPEDLPTPDRRSRFSGIISPREISRKENTKDGYERWIQTKYAKGCVVSHSLLQRFRRYCPASDCI